MTSNGNALLNNTVLNNGEYAILLAYSSGNDILENEASSSNRGIHLSTSDDNTLSGNNIVSNGVSGLHMTSTSNNNTFFNNYLNNNVNADVKQGSVGNVWNTTKTKGTSITGGPYLGGNFWGKPDGTGFSQTTADSDVDGIADGEFNISNSGYADYLPLVAVSDTEQPVIPENLTDDEPEMPENETETNINTTETNTTETTISETETDTYENETA